MGEGARDLDSHSITRGEYYKLKADYEERKIINPNISGIANKIVKAETRFLDSHHELDKPWKEYAKCNIQKVKVDLFFPITAAGVVIACEYCMDCPVKKECKQYAIDNQEMYGVWGGVDFEKEKRDAKYARTHKK